MLCVSVGQYHRPAHKAQAKYAGFLLAEITPNDHYILKNGMLESVKCFADTSNSTDDRHPINGLRLHKCSVQCTFAKSRKSM